MENNEWLQRVIFKLSALHLSGCEFLAERWIFDWDATLPIKTNFSNARHEVQALTTLKQANVIRGSYKENFYRDQQEDQMATKGFGMWGDWDAADPALQLYDYIWYLDGFDYDRFQQFCKTHNLSAAQKLPSLQPPQVTNDRLNTKITEPNGVIDKKKERIASIFLNDDMTLILKFSGTTLEVKHFETDKRYNYWLALKLLARPGEWLGKDDLGANLKTMSTKVKDWPKLMGFSTKQKNIFFNINTKKQKLMFNPQKSLTPEETEILQKLANTQKHQ